MVWSGFQHRRSPRQVCIFLTTSISILLISVDMTSTESGYCPSMCHQIKAWLQQNPNQTIYILHPSQVIHGLDPARVVPHYDSDSLLPAMNASRVAKDPDEVALIQKAIDISSLAHRTILHRITSLKSEAQVHALFLSMCISQGAKLQAYPPIVASGTNASILHYSNNDESLQSKELLCLDAGCEWSCYASDITRTFPLSADGWPSKEAADLYALVEEMQEDCIKMLGPGVRYRNVYVRAQYIAAKGLIRLGLINIPDTPENIDWLVGTSAIFPFFPHGLGHHMGLDVHDVSSKPILSASPKELSEAVLRYALFEPTLIAEWTKMLDLKAPCTADSALLEPGMVITVEPGLYFNRYALSHLYLKSPQWRKLINMEVLEKYIRVGGVRIEDDILITKDGYKNLTKAPKGEEMLRVIREGAGCEHGLGCPFRVDAV